jgi:hypothetical protein
MATVTIFPASPRAFSFSLTLIAALLTTLAVTAPVDAATYYVRTNGGTSTQCTGLADVAYPDSGEHVACAWAHPFWALDQDGVRTITGGDTLVISPGSYMMGFGAPNTGTWCDAAWSWDCYVPPLPSGPDAAHPTRLVGAGWTAGCPAKPELWGTERAWHVLDLTGTSHAVVACLEITDHSACVQSHSRPGAACEYDTSPFGRWAGTGLVASDSTDVRLQDLNIHGLGNADIHAGRLTDWTVEDVRIAGNGWVGWDGDIDGNDSNGGTLAFRRFVIEWNGCAETYPGGAAADCWGQSAGGYGDGFGTGETGGHWIFEDSVFRYDTSDGLDLLYLRLPGQVEVRRTLAYVNAGNPITVSGHSLIENTVMVANCGFFQGKAFTFNVDNCRAGGNAVALALMPGEPATLVNSTVVGHGDVLVQVTCNGLNPVCNGSETVTIQNSVFQSRAEFGGGGDNTAYMWVDADNFYAQSFDYNVVDVLKGVEAPFVGPHDTLANPLFIASGFPSLETFDGHLTTGSPAIDTGLPVGALGGRIPNHDLENRVRPQGAGVDRGAYEFMMAVVITWANPAGIVYGTALGGTQLNATANVAGTFVYTPPAGTVLAVGTHTLSVTFTPTDTATYPPATRTVAIGVVPPFTDGQLTAGSTRVKSIHFVELRQLINTLRTRFSLGAFAWTDATLTAGVTPARALHVNELRTALNAVYVAVGRLAPIYTHATITAGSTVITAVDIAELRAAILAVW